MTNILNPVDLLQKDSKGVDILHSIRVAELTSKLCNLLGLGSKEKEEIILSAAMHDIGKSKIDISILNKPGKLNRKEWNQIKLHPRYGAEIALMEGYGKNIAQNILYHHENSDGTGYPQGVKNEEIPLGASIIRICDSYDAMRSIRPYNRVMSHMEALEELIKTRKIYRADILDEFMKLDISTFHKHY